MCRGPIDLGEISGDWLVTARHFRNAPLHTVHVLCTYHGLTMDFTMYLGPADDPEAHRAVQHQGDQIQSDGRGRRPAGAYLHHVNICTYVGAVTQGAELILTMYSACT